MKQYVSVFILMLQSIWKKLFIILAVLTAADCALFSLGTGRYLWVEDIFSEQRFGLLYCIALLTVLVMLCTSMTGTTRQAYTLQRLALSGHTVFRVQVLVNLTAFLLLWAVQLMTVLLLCRFYLSRQLASADHSLDFCEQSLFLAFYRNEFLHGLFPMGELTRWMRNLALISGLAVTSAYETCHLHYNRKGTWSPYILAGLTLTCFQQEMGSWIADCLLTALALQLMVRVLRILPADGPYMTPDTSSRYSAPSEPAATPEELEVMR